MTAVIAIASASFTSPIILKSDALGGISHRLTNRSGAHVQQTEQLVAGGFAFQVPSAWGRLGASAAGSDSGQDRGSDDELGTVVSGVCPGGSSGAACKDGVQITFIAYGQAAEKGLPALTQFEKQLDSELSRDFKGFEKVGSQLRPNGDGSRWLEYRFSYRIGKFTRHQTVGVFRHVDGRGVVAVANGPQAAYQARSKAIQEFLSGAHEYADE